MLRESSNEIEISFMDELVCSFDFRKLFQGRCFYYSTDCVKSDLNNSKRYFDKSYDITLCAQRMIQGHDSDIRFYWYVDHEVLLELNRHLDCFLLLLLIRNRGLCLPLLKYNIDIRYWIPKVMCGGIEMYRNPNEDIDLWLISR